MWLIDTQTLNLKFITNPEDHRYAILSHTWGGDEVTFEDMKSPGVAETRIGYHKIRKTCERASSQGLDLAWVDTCCIDKSSSAELSESINSMFQWYRLSAVCYAWLEDRDGSALTSMRKSRWFTRGWTLQELIAPRFVEFLDHDWTPRGGKLSLGKLISSVTRIDLDVLQGLRSLSQVAVGRKMSWAASRQTTRFEDRAYSLLGIFDINIPLLYGEGQKVFLRLQEEIARSSSDLSLFAWDIPHDPYCWALGQEFVGIFAPSPDNFKDCGTLVVQSNQFYNLKDFVVTNKGLSIYTSLVPCQVAEWQARGLGMPLWCHREEESSRVLAVPLVRTAFGYVRSHRGVLGSFQTPFPSFSTTSAEDLDEYFSDNAIDPKQILISKVISHTGSEKIKSDDSRFLSIKLPWRSRNMEISARGFPPALWDEDRTGFHLAGCTEFVGIVIVYVKIYSMIGELQVVCGYCKEVGGCWATFVSLKPRIEHLGLERRCIATLSKFRESNDIRLTTKASPNVGIPTDSSDGWLTGITLAPIDEARTNNWHGYQVLRHLIFFHSKEKSGGAPTKTNMHVHELFEFWEMQGGGRVPHIQAGAHLECAGNNNLKEENGEITIEIVGLREQKP